MCVAWFWQQFRQGGKFQTSVFVVLESSAKEFCFVEYETKHSTNRNPGKYMNVHKIILWWLLIFIL